MPFTQFPTSISLSALTAKTGFAIPDVAASELSGYSVRNLGDINGDGIGDLIIGAPSASPGGLTNAGISYVIFGQLGIGSSGTLNLSNLMGSNGFAITGVAAGDQSGFSVSGAGDINGDGVADLIIGAPTAKPGGLTGAGTSYVVFGKSGIGSSGTLALSSLTGSNGFAITGVAAGDNSGISVSGAGDINGDGIDDLIISAYAASPGGLTNAGSSYVIFGKSGIGSSGTLALSSLTGSNGFSITGVTAGDYSGNSVNSAGDVNGDGIDDFIIGASRSSPCYYP